MKPEKGQELTKQKVDLIIVGNQNSGKTSLINKFIDGEKSFSHLYTPTLGISLQKKTIVVGKSEVTVCIWDTAGQQKFFSLTKNYFRKADGVLVIFDLTDKNSFEKVCSFWIEEVKERAAEDSTQIIIGNKVDMKNERAVGLEDAEKFAKSINLAYYETSAKTGEGVQEAISHLVTQCLTKIKENVVQQTFELDPPTEVAANRNRCFGSAKQLLAKFVDKFKGEKQI